MDPAIKQDLAMKLHHHPLSGHSHRAVLASLLNVPHEQVEVDLKGGAHKRPEFLALNPFGQVPVLEDDGVVVADSNAILVYLAKKAGRTDWLPEDPCGAAAVQRWLSVAAGEVAYGPAAARLITVFGAKFNADEVIGRAHTLLSRLEAHLEDADWLVGAQADDRRHRDLQLCRARPGGQCRPLGLPERERLSLPCRSTPRLRTLREDTGRPGGIIMSPTAGARLGAPASPQAEARER